MKTKMLEQCKKIAKKLLTISYLYDIILQASNSAVSFWDGFSPNTANPVYIRV